MLVVIVQQGSLLFSEMKDKRVVVFLILLMLVIWGMVGIRIYSGIKESSLPIVKKVMHSQDNYNVSVDIDTLKMDYSYRNPFLTKVPVSDVTPGKVRQPWKIQAVNKSSKVSIVYKGVVRKSNGKAGSVFLFEIDNKTILAKKGVKVQNFMLEKFIHDSVIVIYEDVKYKLPLTNKQ